MLMYMHMMCSSDPVWRMEEPTRRAMAALRLLPLLLLSCPRAALAGEGHKGLGKQLAGEGHKGLGKQAAGKQAGKHAGKHTGRHGGGGGGGGGGDDDSGAGMRATAVRIASLLRLARRLPIIRTLEELESVATAIATPDRELLFTTVTMDRPLFQLVFLRQWQGNLRTAAPNALLLATDNRTCEIALNATIPCFVDGLAPALSGKQNHFGSQVLLKW